MGAEQQDRWSFLVNFIRHPLRNASVVPSSRVGEQTNVHRCGHVRLAVCG